MAHGLHTIGPRKGATSSRKRVGRGPGSGLGKTSGKGHKGQNSRSGYSHLRGHEGGQMPLHRRIPKRGFTNIFRTDWVTVTLAQLEARFAAGTAVTPESLRAAGAVKRTGDGLKVLGTGELKKALTVSAHKFTEGARKKIEAAGGRCEVLPA
ncbi:MAG TPA: 50S ribosomal protein L15 [Thermoanaerobaculia bacterium]|nr:50S ribosomal protein L15 [Thermoanaerobaculia bacterium]HQR68908.1 50S ribosomal protein L15 [Thermoanaerobaculia bacterium]